MPTLKKGNSLEHVISHSTIANRVGARGASADHAANLSAWGRVDGEEERNPSLFQLGIQSIVRHARLDNSILVFS